MCVCGGGVALFIVCIKIKNVLVNIFQAFRDDMYRGLEL